MGFVKKNISSILLAAFVIVAVLAFYSPMYAYQEGLQIFMFNGDFFVDTCLRPGGLSDYVGCFFVQFFMYPHWTTLILTALVVGMHLMLKRVFIHNGCNEKASEMLGVMCALGMVAAVASFNVMFGGCVAVLIAVAAAKLAVVVENKFFFAVLTPVIYFVSGGWCCLIYIAALTVKSLPKKDFVSPAVNIVLLAFSWLIVKRIMQDDSLYGTFTGVDFNRNPDKNCAVWYVSVVIIIMSIALSKMDALLEKNIVRMSGYIVAVIGLIVYMTTKYNADLMLDYKLDRMVRYKQWDKIVSTMQGKKSTTNFAKCYLNLALSELGVLDKKMFDFVQVGAEGLVSSTIDSQNKSICNSEVYFRLGLFNISERLTGEAMESINTFQKSARLYKRLAEIALVTQQHELAMRYLKKLQATIYYRVWAKRAEQYLNDPAHTEALADWKIKPLTMKNDVFYTPSTGAYFLYNLLVNNPHSVKVLNYFVAYLMLDKNISKLHEFLTQYRSEDDMGICVYEAVILHLFINNKEEFNKIMTENNDLTRRFADFCNFMSSGGAQNPQKAKELYGKTYWFYYYFCN